jgi:hypothetical protein
VAPHRTCLGVVDDEAHRLGLGHRRDVEHRHRRRWPVDELLLAARLQDDDGQARLALRCALLPLIGTIGVLISSAIMRNALS